VASILTRWLQAIAPVPVPETPDPAVLAQKRKQKRLIAWTAAIILVLASAGYTYSYVASAPDRARAEVALGIRQMGPGAYDQAIAHFDRAIAIWPEFADAYLNRAVAEHSISQRPAALADLDKSLDLNPNLIRAYNERGQIYLENADPQHAIQEFDKSLQVKPSLEGYYQRGLAYEYLGQHQKAIADFDAAISEFREAPYTYRARAAAKRKLDDREGAADDERVAEQIESASPR